MHNICTTCEANTIYSIQTHTCLACPAGSYSNVGDTVCSKCYDDGKYLNIDKNGCVSSCESAYIAVN